MTADRQPVIVAAVRSPIGRRAGALSSVHPADLLAMLLPRAIEDSRASADEIDQILVGCVTQAGEQGLNIARTAALAAGLPASVPGTTLDAQCGSSQQAVNLASCVVASGGGQLVLAAGVESMSRLPLRTAVDCGPGDPITDGYRSRYEITTQGEAAERIADRWKFDRQACDAFALESQNYAADATLSGRFRSEIVTVEADGRTIVDDEGVRPTTSDGLAALRPAFRPDGRHTAGNSSQISDGAAALLVASRRWAEAHSAPVRGRIIDQVIVGVDPVEKLTGPIPATRALLSRQQLEPHDIDVFEINEAFASVTLAWMKEFSVPRERVNPNGGAIALGHPVGATGARLVVSMLHELERRGGGRGLIAMCCGGGLGTATLIEVR